MVLIDYFSSAVAGNQGSVLRAISGNNNYPGSVVQNNEEGCSRGFDRKIINTSNPLCVSFQPSLQ